MNVAKRILLVDDNDDIAEMLQILLQEHGYAFLHAADGTAALAVCPRQMPHLILMDILLPDMDGFEVSRRLHGQPRTAHIPIIFLSRHAERDDRLEAFELGADDFIAKPFDPEELLLRVRNSMDRAEQKHLIDRFSGLPNAFVARDYLAQARTNPAQAIIEITLQHSTPYYERYGVDATRQAQGHLGQIVVWALDQLNVLEGFAGHLDEDQWIVVCPVSQALPVAERVASIFNFQVTRYYDDEDHQQSYLTLDNRQYPLMHVTCRVHTSQDSYEVS